MNLHRSALPLQSHQVLRSWDFDETRTFLRNKQIEFFANKSKHCVLQARIHAAYLPNMYLSYVEYGAPVGLAASAARGDYGIQLPLRGQIQSVVGSTEVGCDRMQAVIGSPQRDQTTWSTADCGRLLLSIKRDAVVRHLAALLGDAVTQPLIFEPAMSVVDGYGRSLAKQVRLAVDELDDDGSLLSNPLVAQQFEQLILTELLVSQPSNYSDRLGRQGHRAIAPRDVRRALDYIHAYPQRPLGIEDLVAASGVPGRTLYQHFRDFVGISPMAYVRRVRLQRVHDELSRDAAAQSITAVAFRWGFTHLGRFSADYRRAYGEKPSQTLAKTRH